MNKASSLLFTGLPNSGKTTYLAALWHVIEAQIGQTKLKLKRYSGDRAYLNHITQAWRGCMPVPRTRLQTDVTTVTLHLEGDSFGEFTLSVPDLSGEAFDHQIEHRRMEASHANLLKSSDGVILFLHPDVQKGTQIVHQEQLAGSIGGITELENANDVDQVASNPWSVEMIPTQVKLVELIQFIMEYAKSPLRLAVVISAWDLVKGTIEYSPHEYVSRSTPLLRQFLDANDDLLEYRIFGVSAQGGSIPEDRDKLLKLDELTRITVCDCTASDHDITRPIAWLLEGN